MSKYEKDIAEQVAIIIQTKRELDDALGDNTYPENWVVHCAEWVNKWHMSRSIQAQRQTQYKDKSKKTNKEYSGDMTEKQRKAVFVISHDNNDGQWISNDKFKYLPEDWENNMTFEEASEFIDKYGEKKKEQKYF